MPCGGQAERLPHHTLGEGPCAHFTDRETEDQRGWNRVRGYLPDECLTSLHDALKRVCVSERGSAGLREAGTRDLGVCAALHADQYTSIP